MESLMISVIMPCNLGLYSGAATERPLKLRRAIDSFLEQVYAPKELIVVSDGCSHTSQLIETQYSDQYPKIRSVEIKRQINFSGQVRKCGISLAKGDVICYLDSDDIFAKGHLRAIADNFKDNDWIFFDDTLWKGDLPSSPRRICNLAMGSCGVSNIAHKRSLDVSWEGCDGYGHDWEFIKKLMSATRNYDKIDHAGYYVTHIPGLIDF